MEKVIGFIIKKKRLEQNMSQESLCKGICGISYLSKIETGSAKADLEIISQLFKVLGISFIDNELDYEEGEIYKTLDQYFTHTITSEKLVEIKEKYSSLMYSTKVITYELLNFIVTNIESNNVCDEKSFEKFENYVDRKQLYYFYMIMAMFLTYKKNDKDKALFYYDRAFMINPEGKALYNIAVTHYIAGDYNRAIENFNKDFILQIDLGNIDDAVNDCIYLANSYSNLNSIPLMEKYFDKAISLSKGIDDNVKGNIYYNLGATYMKIDLMKSLKYLKMAEEVNYGLSHFYLYQKMILVYLELGEKSKAIGYLIRMKELESIHGVIDIANGVEMIRMLEIICYDEDYIKNSEYGDILSKLYYDKEEKSHYGFKLFFASYYVKWLKANRKYKEALEVVEELFSL